MTPRCSETDRVVLVGSCEFFPFGVAFVARPSQPGTWRSTSGTFHRIDGVLESACSTTRTKDTTDKVVPRPLLRASPGWARPMDVREASKQPHPNGNRTTTRRLHGNWEAHGDVCGRAEPGKSNHPTSECEEIDTSRLQFVLPSLGLARPGREDALQAASCRRLLRDALDVVQAETPCIRGNRWIEGRPCHIHVRPPTHDPVVKDTVAYH